MLRTNLWNNRAYRGSNSTNGRATPASGSSSSNDCWRRVLPLRVPGSGGSFVFLASPTAREEIDRKGR